MPFSRSDPDALLGDLTVVALVVAHGTDADLDPRESRVVVERLSASAEAFAGRAVSMAELSHEVETAIERYRRLTVPDVDVLVARVGAALGEARTGAAFAMLVAVAEADGAVSVMERTVLRHIAEAWGVTTLE